VNRHISGIRYTTRKTVGSRHVGEEKGIKAMGKLKLKSRMKNLLMFLPNMVALSVRLMVDSRVPRTERALFAAAVIYAIVPFDFLPDMIPFIGQVDDIFLIALTLLRLIDHTDDSVVRQHWRGGGDIVALAESVATIAPVLMPRRVARVLLARVKPTAEGTGLLMKSTKFEPLLVAEDKPGQEPEGSRKGPRRLKDVKSA
jgi:uncharacterized membrane protein YkvA (DUF1232 family)